MTGFELLAMLFMWAMGAGGGTTPFTPSSPRPTPSPARSPKPAPSGPSVKPTQVKLPPGKPESPKPWPAAIPADLPTYPEGWEPYVPPPAPVVSRARALIPELWKNGQPGTTKVEQTNGVWVTYVSFKPTDKTKGVAAYRLSQSAPQAASPKSSALVPVKGKAPQKRKPTRS